MKHTVVFTDIVHYLNINACGVGLARILFGEFRHVASTWGAAATQSHLTALHTQFKPIPCFKNIWFFIRKRHVSLCCRRCKGATSAGQCWCSCTHAKASLAHSVSTSIHPTYVFKSRSAHAPYTMALCLHSRVGVALRPAEARRACARPVIVRSGMKDAADNVAEGFVQIFSKPQASNYC